jgi:hypothetical protein
MGIEGVKNAHMPMVAALMTSIRRDGKKSRGHDYDVVPRYRRGKLRVTT